MKGMDEANPQMKIDFLNQLMDKENVNCTIIEHIYQFSMRSNYYSSHTLMNNWEKWQKPLLLNDKTLLAKIIHRIINHCHLSYNPVEKIH